MVEVDLAAATVADFPPPPRLGAQVVWLKRDLRRRDHAALSAAAVTGAPVLPLYLVEPEILTAPDADALHWEFVADCLRELRAALAAEHGLPLLVRQGEAVAELAALRAATGFVALWSHEETGNALTFARDRRVRRWAREVGVAWRELPQNGVVRALRDRDGWARQWEARARAPAPPPLPARVPTLLGADRWGAATPIPTAAELGLRHAAPRLPELVQRGGETAAWATLHSFLHERGHAYSRAMSSPLTATTGCSRLSSHLAYGTLSPWAIVRTTRARDEALRASPEPGFARTGLSSFLSRLRWRDHFCQKLESEPAIEWQNFSRAADGLREAEWQPERFAAWAEGRTGYPLVDACLRSLSATGWLNFRMRAMLVSFAAYDLWLDWRGLRDWLARQFQDYEPGIHVSQLQMQSGTTGINTLRIYSPVKQSLDHDPQAAFIARWVPELTAVPAPLRHTPWRLSPTEAAAAHLEQTPPGSPAAVAPRPGALARYPLPVVRHEDAVAHAKARLRQVRSGPLARAEAARVFAQHGSRAGPVARRLRGDDAPAFDARRRAEHDARQAELRFGE